VWGVKYEAAVLTNITHEHLDYHKTIDEYAQTKWRLVEMAHVSLVNNDDYVAKELITTKKAKNIRTYGLLDKADYSVDFRKEIADLADFNAYNYLGAYGLCRELGVGEKDVLAALKTFKLPAGRIDVVFNKEFMVIVDFAHTPNAIKRILQTVKKLHLKKGGNIIHVFGSAALRDVTKRPMMGEMSAQYADISIITEEDYRTEDPAEIAEQIGNGFKNRNKEYITIINREDAIKKALTLAQKNDVVVITGKGHEKSLCRGKIEYPWSDIDCVKKYVSI
jgi:UDP-N-acetylmuramoyl-L-alanyl-D-glutamate--2,6-diaminopimelate ligase